jgi:hypothetical protein
MQSDASSSAADLQSQAAQNQIDLQQKIFNTQNQQQAPYRAAGYTSLNQIGSMLPGQYQQYDYQGNPIGTATGTGYLTNQFSNADLMSNLAPNYEFQLGQGQKANLMANNALGGLVGGNTLKGLQDYTQNYAGNAYQQAFTNYQNQRSNIYNTLAGIAGIGQTGQTATNNLASNYGTNVANLATGSAAAQAAGQIGSANAFGGAIGNAANMYSLSNILGSGGGGIGNIFGSGANTGGYSGGINFSGFSNPFSVA